MSTFSNKNMLYIKQLNYANKRKEICTFIYKGISKILDNLARYRCRNLRIKKKIRRTVLDSPESQRL